MPKILGLFGKRNAMAIIRNLLLETTLRFNEIHRKVGGSPKTVQRRLEELVSFGIVKRKQYREIPPKVEYSLTEQGKELEQIFENISVWSGKWHQPSP
ncbi:MAG: winged helix-turn-helix transcriptional regulator [Promethearchaeota archaeon]